MCRSILALQIPGRARGAGGIRPAPRNPPAGRQPARAGATLVEGFQKVVNRITGGLVLAGLIVGAAMPMRVETSLRTFGYPDLAMLCFLEQEARAALPFRHKRGRILL